jgi:hypothetical protein
MAFKLQSKRSLQLAIGFATGIVFGFLLQKGGVTNYDVIIRQLQLTDFTVVKVMMSAVITGMLGVHLLKKAGLVQLHPKPGSLGTTVIGGLLFGVGFAVLGYCPGTAVAAAAQGSLDALIGGCIGISIGAGIFAALYARLEKSILAQGTFRKMTLPELLNLNEWVIIIPFCIIITALLFWLEVSGR